MPVSRNISQELKIHGGGIWADNWGRLPNAKVSVKCTWLNNTFKVLIFTIHPHHAVRYAWQCPEEAT